jgi:TATA-binding protein-associated factor
VLLETGSTTLVRNTAAKQLANIQRQHPHELYNLLARVAPYLRNREWECRVAAGKAIGGIAENVPLWDPNAGDSMQDVKPENILDTITEADDNDSMPGFSDKITQSRQSDDDDTSDCRLLFNTFDLLQVLRNGEKLLGSAGKVRVS